MEPEVPPWPSGSGSGSGAGRVRLCLGTTLEQGAAGVGLRSREVAVAWGLI